MYIGKLNDRMTIDYSLTKLDSRAVPRLLENGNPFLGQRLAVSWSELLASGLALHLTIPAGFLINNLVVHLTEDSAPASVSVYSEDKQRLFSCYSGETGKHITEKVLVLPVEKDVTSLVLEAVSDFSDIVYDQIEIYGAELSGIALYPTPEYCRIEDRMVSLSSFPTVSGCPEAAQVLREKLGMRLKEAADSSIDFLFDLSISKNGFRLLVENAKIQIFAADLQGFVMGAETLVKLAQNHSVPVCEIRDAPFAEFRGVHLYLPSESQMEFAKRLVKYLLSPMGYNYLIIEVAGAMAFDSHPEINTAVRKAYVNHRAGKWPEMPHSNVADGTTVSKAAVRDFVDYVRSFGIEVIPEVQSLGHVQFMTLAHPEIAERHAEAAAQEATDERLADVPPSDFYAHSFCPSNPRSYEILFDLLEEILAVFRPREFVHMGHDEVYQIGVCPVCKGKDPADLFAADVCLLHDYLAKKGLRMMIWADMLQPVSSYKTVAAIERIPKDIFLLDFIWYFHTDKDIEDNLLPHGFDVAFGNMYSSHFPRFESRIRKNGICGGQLSAWVPTTEHDLAKEGKLYDFLYTARMLWSGSYTRYTRYAYDRILSELIPTLRQQIRGIPEPSRQPGAAETVLLGKRQFNPSDTSGETVIPVNGFFDSLVWEHAASKVYRRLPWLELDVIGYYTVCYADGKTMVLPQTYAGIISHWNRRHNEPFSGQYYRHNGYSATWHTDGIETLTPDGRRATLYRWEWVNPQPQKKILEVRFTPAPDAETDVIIHKLSGWIKPE